MAVVSERLRMLVWVNAAPKWCASLVIEDVPDTFYCRVTEAAPILKWAVGKHWAEVICYFRRKGYEVVMMEDPA